MSDIVDDFTRRQHELVALVETALATARLDRLQEAARREVERHIGPVVDRRGLHRLDEAGDDRPSKEQMAGLLDRLRNDDLDGPL